MKAIFTILRPSSISLVRFQEGLVVLVHWSEAKTCAGCDEMLKLVCSADNEKRKRKKRSAYMVVDR